MSLQRLGTKKEASAVCKGLNCRSLREDIHSASVIIGSLMRIWGNTELWLLEYIFVSFNQMNLGQPTSKSLPGATCFLWHYSWDFAFFKWVLLNYSFKVTRTQTLLNVILANPHQGVLWSHPITCNMCKMISNYPLTSCGKCRLLTEKIQKLQGFP